MKNNISIVLFRWMGALGCALTLIPMAHAQTIRLHGGVALAKAIEGKKAAIEAQSGVKLEVVGNGAGRGLTDLGGGQAEIALLAGSLKGVMDAENKEKPGSVDIAQMKEIPLTTSKAAFATHPSAGVKSLSDAQLHDILTGKISNWKEAGGADLPVKLVLASGGDGARITLQNTLLQGADYTKDAIIRTTSKDVCVVVAQLPGSCAVIGIQNLDGNVVKVAMEKEILIPWSLVIKGEPSGDLKKVIEATLAAFK